MTHARRFSSIVALAGAVSVTTGCATIFNGSRQELHFTSRPLWACVELLPDQLLFTTPHVLEVGRDKSRTAIFRLSGFQTRAVQIERDVAKAVWFNFLLLNVIGISVDIATGSAYELKPAQVDVDLQPEPAGSAEAGASACDAAPAN